MPWINKPKKKPYIIDRNRENRQEIYQTQRWKNLKNTKLIQEPLCFVCACEGKLKDVEEHHHLDSYMNYEGQMRLSKAYDPNNIIGLCKKHHNESHSGALKDCLSKEEYIERLKFLKRYNPIDGLDELFGIKA